jgi:Family of unknown function (DUF5681)
MHRKPSRQRNGPYKVGKGRPPLATRWQNGQSGNPKGRPRGSRNISAVLAEVIRQKIPVTENGRTRRIPALEIMLRRLANDAMLNDPRALKFLLSLVDRYAEPPEAQTNLDELLAQDDEILSRYRQS